MFWFVLCVGGEGRRGAVFCVTCCLFGVCYGLCDVFVCVCVVGVCYVLCLCLSVVVLLCLLV